MTITAATRLSDELRLLSISGVRDARGHRRIAALVPALEKSGRRIAVFARLAAQTRTLLEAPRGRAPSELLALNTLVGAVLRTQGAAAPAGELGRFPEGGATSRVIPASALRALEDGDGKTYRSVVGEASARRWFEDPRLARIGLDRLRSSGCHSSGELFRRTIPRHGESIVPLLASALEDAARAGGVNARWASTLIDGWREADPASAEALARQLLDAGSPRAFPVRWHGNTLSTSVRFAALRCLGDDAKARAMLAAHLDDDDRRTRELARWRLLALSDDSVQGLKTLSRSSAEAVATMDGMDRLPAGSWTDVALGLGYELRGKLYVFPPAKGKRPARGISRADASVLASLVRLLMRSEISDDRLELLASVLLYAETLTKRAEGFDDESALELFELLVASRTSRHDTLVSSEETAVAMNIDAGRTLRALLGRHELRRVALYVDRAERATLVRALESVYGVDVSQPGAASRDGLPPPADWGFRWLDSALAHDFVGLAEHLAVLDSDFTTSGVLEMTKARATSFAHVALSANPDCARRLKGRIVRRGAKGETLVSLCNAIERRDAARCRTLANELADAIGAESAAALGKRLASWVGRKRRAA